MIRCEATLEVRRPAAEVFAFLDDFAKVPLWLSSCSKIERTSPGEKRIGSTLHYSYKEGPRTGRMDGAVTEYEPGRRLAMKFHDKMFDVAVAFRVEPAGELCRVTHTIEIAPRTLVGRLMKPMIAAATTKQVASDSARLKELLAAGA